MTDPGHPSQTGRAPRGTRRPVTALASPRDRPPAASADRVGRLGVPQAEDRPQRGAGEGAADGHHCPDPAVHAEGRDAPEEAAARDLAGIGIDGLMSCPRRRFCLGLPTSPGRQPSDVSGELSAALHVHRPSEVQYRGTGPKRASRPATNSSCEVDSTGFETCRPPSVMTPFARSTVFRAGAEAHEAVSRMQTHGRVERSQSSGAAPLGPGQPRRASRNARTGVATLANV